MTLKLSLTLIKKLCSLVSKLPFWGIVVKFSCTFSTLCLGSLLANDEEIQLLSEQLSNTHLAFIVGEFLSFVFKLTCSSKLKIIPDLVFVFSSFVEKDFSALRLEQISG